MTARGPILVVDDEADLISTYERLLRRGGYRAVTVGTRGAGLAIVEREPLALVITDLRLPDGDGLDRLGHACAAGEATPQVQTPS